MLTTIFSFRISWFTLVMLYPVSTSFLSANSAQSCLLFCCSKSGEIKVLVMCGECYLFLNFKRSELITVLANAYSISNRSRHTNIIKYWMPSVCLWFIFLLSFSFSSSMMLAIIEEIDSTVMGCLLRGHLVG